MATHKSAIKRHRQSLKRRHRNRLAKGAVRSALKEVVSAAKAGDKKAASDVLRAAERTVAKAAAKGILHRNNAARKISRVAKLVSAMR